MSNLSTVILNGCTKFVRSLLPRHCVLCGADTADQALCTGCAAALPLAGIPACPTCALPLADDNTFCPTPTTSGETRSFGIVCGSCLSNPPAFDHTRAAFRYGFPVDRLLHAFKYGGDLTLAETLALPLARSASTLPRPDLLLPMPLHPTRLKERGFNQALEIARPLARWFGLPLVADGCQRVRDTPSQAGMQWKERRRNVRGAFACDLDLNGKSIAVVDDVMTTGATLNEISRALKSRGAAAVSAWVVARTMRD